MPANVAPLKVVQNADGTGYIAEMNAQDTIALQNLVAALRLLGGLTPTAGRIPLFTGDNAASVVALSANGAFWDCIPKIDGGGGIEIGSLIDFHNASNDTADFYVRLYVDNNRNLLRVPGNNTGQNLLMYDQGNILGAVSQNGGIPTGKLIESGGNVNGRYIRFASGLQICHGISGTVNCQSPVVGDNGRISDAVTFTWPAAFSEMPAVVWGVNYFYGYMGMAGTDSQVSTTGGRGFLFTPPNITNGAGQITYHAIGRWFQ